MSSCSIETLSVIKKIPFQFWEGLIFCTLIKFIARGKINLSLSDPTALVLVKGVIAMGKFFRKFVKRIVESTAARAIYDWLKHLFDEDDDD